MVRYEARRGQSWFAFGPDTVQVCDPSDAPWTLRYRDIQVAHVVDLPGTLRLVLVGGDSLTFSMRPFDSNVALAIVHSFSEHGVPVRRDVIVGP